MSHPVAAIWRAPLPEIDGPLERCLTHISGPTRLFFRADDVADPDARLQRLLQLFIDHETPLCPAVVPTWLTPARWRHLQILTRAAPDLFCWHQHGFAHVNHETFGKKQEFGPSRSTEALATDIVTGRDLLADIMGLDFFPVFTPPWNRMSFEALELLQQHQFQAVSRFQGNQPAPPAGLAEFPVNVDLHTRRATDIPADWQKLFDELALALSTGLCGIMLHHLCMNDAAFRFLARLLEILHRSSQIRFVDFRSLIAPAKT